LPSTVMVLGALMDRGPFSGDVADAGLGLPEPVPGA